jgi:hypothetical protein
MRFHVGRPTDHVHPRVPDVDAGCCAAFVLDPDGNHIEAVFRGASMRSAPSVVIAPDGA